MSACGNQRTPPRKQYWYRLPSACGRPVPGQYASYKVYLHAVPRVQHELDRMTRCADCLTAKDRRITKKEFLRAYPISSPKPTGNVLCRGAETDRSHVCMQHWQPASASMASMNVLSSDYVPSNSMVVHRIILGGSGQRTSHQRTNKPTGCSSG